jgi:hypothetical protein
MSHAGFTVPFLSTRKATAHRTMAASAAAIIDEVLTLD